MYISFSHSPLCPSHAISLTVSRPWSYHISPSSFLYLFISNINFTPLYYSQTGRQTVSTSLSLSLFLTLAAFSLSLVVFGPRTPLPLCSIMFLAFSISVSLHPYLPLHSYFSLYLGRIIKRRRTIEGRNRRRRKHYLYFKHFVGIYFRRIHLGMFVFIYFGRYLL